MMQKKKREKKNKYISSIHAGGGKDFILRGHCGPNSIFFACDKQIVAAFTADVEGAVTPDVALESILFENSPATCDLSYSE